MLMMGHDHPYVGSRIEALGYRGAKDLLAYLLDLEKAPSEGLKRVISKQPKNLRIRPLDTSRYREDIGTITAIFNDAWRSEEHTSELQSLLRNSYAVLCFKKKQDIQKKP